MDPQAAAPFGTIVLAAYQPNPILFERQLLSIRNQTHENFECVITADGGAEKVQRLVRDIVCDDVRFRVAGFDKRLGFYGNFERGLTLVNPSALWVALSDQDDYWYPEKLQRLIPRLAHVSLVSGQARVVTDTGEVISPSTNRQRTDICDLLVQNQVTGGLSLFRRELLDVALPFPKLATLTQNHDHWIGVAAAAWDSYEIIDDVVQDYVQHGSNVIGEATESFNPVRSVRRARELALRYEGSSSFKSVAMMVATMTFGWKAIMLRTLEERLPARTKGLSAALDTFDSVFALPRILALLAKGVTSSRMELGPALTHVAGLLKRGDAVKRASSPSD
ncbi:glycosyltransferase involved in cell wall biosynthesis [Arthrobacter sp. B2I5]|uniref:glycosyltransferase n=1 Tax=Arthrobacter sp. B2I5 TaxID=3042266 RepID=UPI00277ED95C|nr:glycosyltransferase [Arthrobacter sp. B2I5]MDQ0825143.1 glycosyltransferase involved in cell wall biosynthesis [Arthrobacter sp. B2I5]